MKKESILKKSLVDIFPIIILFVFGIWYINKQNIHEAERELEKESGNNMPIIEIATTGNDINSNLGLELTGDINSIHKDFQFVENCFIENTGNYKILDVFSSPSKSPFDPEDYLKYTKLFNISGEITDAKLCIVSDVVNYRKIHQYTYSTYMIFGDSSYAGHINVGYSMKTKVVYDKNSGGSPDLDGRFWGDESPKIYNLNLDSVKVADLSKGGTKIIHPLKRLQQEGNIRIGGFVNAKNGEGRIDKFVLAYKCKEGSDCIIQ